MGIALRIKVARERMSKIIKERVSDEKTCALRRNECLCECKVLCEVCGNISGTWWGIRSYTFGIGAHKVGE